VTLHEHCQVPGSYTYFAIVRVNRITYKIHPENGKDFSEKIYGDRRYVNIGVAVFAWL
jgi:hypothetical protein